jgi:hypothetical protein
MDDRIAKYCSHSREVLLAKSLKRRQTSVCEGILSKFMALAPFMILYR